MRAAPAIMGQVGQVRQVRRVGFLYCSYSDLVVFLYRGQGVSVGDFFSDF